MRKRARKYLTPPGERLMVEMLESRCLLSATSVVILDAGVLTGSAGAPVGATVSSDGASWYANGNALERVSSDGRSAEYALPAAADGTTPAIVTNLVVTADNSVWFGVADDAGEHIERMTAGGNFTEVAGTEVGAGGQIVGLTTGSDGNVWFSARDVAGIATLGYVTEAGSVGTFKISQSQASTVMTQGLIVDNGRQTLVLENVGMTTMAANSGNGGATGHVAFTLTSAHEISGATTTVTGESMAGRSGTVVDSGANAIEKGMTIHGREWGAEMSQHLAVVPSGGIKAPAGLAGAVAGNDDPGVFEGEFSVAARTDLPGRDQGGAEDDGTASRSEEKQGVAAAQEGTAQAAELETPARAGVAPTKPHERPAGLKEFAVTELSSPVTATARVDASADLEKGVVAGRCWTVALGLSMVTGLQLRSPPSRRVEEKRR